MLILNTLKKERKKEIKILKEKNVRKKKLGFFEIFHCSFLHINLSVPALYLFIRIQIRLLLFNSGSFDPDPHHWLRQTVNVEGLSLVCALHNQ